MTFFENYTYRQKNYALLVIVLLLVAVSYKKGFLITQETLGYRTELKDQLQLAEHANESIRLKRLRIQQLNQVIGKENVSVERVQQGFLNFFAKQAKEISVYQIDEVLKYQHPDFTINTHRITLKGGFNPSLSFLYQLERDFNLGRLVNLTFDYTKKTAEEEPVLYTTLLIQNYSK